MSAESKRPKIASAARRPTTVQRYVTVDGSKPESSQNMFHVFVLVFRSAKRQTGMRTSLNVGRHPVVAAAAEIRLLR